MGRLSTGFAAAALAGGALGCGGASHRPVGSRAVIAPTESEVAVTTTAPAGRYLSDGDAEKVDDHDPDNHGIEHEDHDGDSTEEYADSPAGRSYHDADDAALLGYGHPVARGKQRQVAAVVERYYAAAAEDEGAKACTLMVSAAAKAVPEDYGQAPGPAYLRGAKTCAAVASRLFTRYHHSLSGVVHVTGVRARGGRALTLVGSTTMPASYLFVERGGGTWKVDQVLASTLP